MNIDKETLKELVTFARRLGARRFVLTDRSCDVEFWAEDSAPGVERDKNDNEDELYMHS